MHVFLHGEQVDFEYDAMFFGNQVLTDGPGSAGSGGGMCVASSGDVVFEDSAFFTANEAESGGQGGAVANFGHLVFKSASTFASNTAQGELGKVFHQQQPPAYGSVTGTVRVL